MNAKHVITTIADGVKDGEEFHFEFFGKPVGCQITSWNGNEGKASCVNIWFDGSTVAYISDHGMSLNYVALMVCSSIVDHAKEFEFENSEAIHDALWNEVESNSWLNGVWMENADNRKKEDDE